MDEPSNFLRMVFQSFHTTIEIMKNKKSCSWPLDSGPEYSLKTQVSQIVVYYLPPKVTSLTQLLDQGVIYSRKTKVQEDFFQFSFSRKL